MKGLRNKTLETKSPENTGHHKHGALEMQDRGNKGTQKQDLQNKEPQEHRTSKTWNFGNTRP